MDKAADVYPINRLGKTALDLAAWLGKREAIAAPPDALRSKKIERVKTVIGVMLSW
jgi:hypothetical protein